MEISIFKFLLRCYGIKLDANANLSHDEIISNFTFLKPCSFDYASDNKELVYTGKIVYVRDSLGIVKPYFTPVNVLNFQDEECLIEDTSKVDKELDEEITLISENISKIPTYKLGELLSKYKKYYSFYRMIKIELMKRGVYQNKIFRIDKEIIKLEESGINDKYQRRRKVKRKKS